MTKVKKIETDLLKGDAVKVTEVENLTKAELIDLLTVDCKVEKVLDTETNVEYFIKVKVTRKSSGVRALTEFPTKVLEAIQNLDMPTKANIRDKVGMEDDEPGNRLTMNAINTLRNPNRPDNERVIQKLVIETDEDGNEKALYTYIMAV